MAGRLMEQTVSLLGELDPSFESMTGAASESLADLAKQAKNGEEVTKNFEKSMRQMGDVTGDLGDGFTVMKGIMANLATQAIQAGARAISDFARESIDAGMEFTATMSQVEAISGATSSQMQMLEDTARQYGATTKFSANEAAEAMTYMAMAGWDAQQSANGLPGILYLAAAAGEDLATTSDIVTDGLTAFGLKSNDATHFADVMAQASSKANTNVSMMGETFKYAGAVCGSMGISIEDAAIATGLMANAGTKASNAGTALRTGLTNLIKPTKQMATAMKKYGVEIKTNEDGSVNLMETMRGVRASMADLETTEQSAAIAAIFGKEAMSGWSAIVNASESDFNNLATAIYNSNGAAERMSRIMQDNLQGDLDNFNSALGELQLTVFDKVEPLLRGATQLATGVIQGFTAVLKPQKTILDSFVDDVKEGNGEIEKILENAKSAIENAGIETESLESYKQIILDLNDIEGKNELQKYQMKVAVEKLSGVVPGLAEAFNEEAGSVEMANGSLKELLDTSIEAAKREALLKAEKDLIDANAEAYVNLERAKAADAKANDDAGKALDKITEKIVKYKINAEDAYDSYLTEDGETWDELSDRVIKTADTLKTAQEQYDETVQMLSEEFGISIEEIENADFSNNSVSGTQGDISNLGETTGQTAEEIEAAAQAAQAAFEEMANSISSSIQSSVSAFSEFNGGEEVGIEQMLANLESQKAGLENWTKNMELLGQQAGQGMTQEFYDYLAQLGPQGANIVQELVDNMGTEQFAQVAQTYSETLQLQDEGAIIASYTSAGTGIQQAVEQPVEEAGKNMETAMQTSAGIAGSNIVTEFSTAMETVYSNVQSSLSSLQGLFANTKFSFSQNIAVPHFSMAGSFDAKSGSVPSVSVSWYKEGGILDGAQIFGALGGEFLGGGEAGQEAVLPLDTLWKRMGEVFEETLAEARRNEQSQTAIAGRLLDIEDFSLSDMAHRNDSITYNMGGVTFAPTVNVNGSGNAEGDIMDQLREQQYEFFDWLESWIARKELASYA